MYLGTVVWMGGFALSAEKLSKSLTHVHKPFLKNNTERITRIPPLPRVVRPFRVYGQLTRSRVHWHVHKSSLPEEKNKGDTSETRTRAPRVTIQQREATVSEQ